VDEYTQAVTDLCRPASFYPTARALERRIVAHVGPTNSGKTHAALAALRSARSGLYAGPLRLLAWQVHDQLRAQGTPCNLVTGQERWEEGAAHTACTVEMASTRSPVEVAVLDEVQLVADAARGWAFTRALLGLPAATLHVCGDPAVLPLLERVVAESGGCAVRGGRPAGRLLPHNHGAEAGSQCRRAAQIRPCHCHLRLFCTASQPSNPHPKPAVRGPP
jgi:ATP-dependent RNA helicase SUPV3L1/SUV3